MTDGEFEKIDEKDERVLGPSAILVAGFAPDIEAPLLSVLRECGAAAHRVVLCSQEMVKQPLREALSVTEQPEPARPDKLPRVMILSGLNGAQLQGFLSSYRSSGLPKPIFAAVTPANLEFPVGKLIMELLREQRAMSGRR